MIQNAFTNAYTSKVQAQNQTINTVTGGIKDAAVLAAGIAGFSGELGDGAVAKGAKHALAGRVGGVGGNIMLATMQEKKDSAQANEERNNLFTAKEVGDTIKSQLGDNPINRSALKQLGTVFETIQRAKEEEVLNKKGNIESSIGDIDPNSELGKKIIANLDKEDKD